MLDVTASGILWTLTAAAQSAAQTADGDPAAQAVASVLIGQIILALLVVLVFVLVMFTLRRVRVHQRLVPDEPAASENLDLTVDAWEEAGRRAS